VAQLTLDTEPWLSCDDCFRQVDQYVEQLLARRAEQMPAMAAHLRGCPACVEEAETVLVLAADDDGLDPEEALVRFADYVHTPTEQAPGRDHATTDAASPCLNDGNV
jgi:hypothetical protein